LKIFDAVLVECFVPRPKELLTSDFLALSLPYIQMIATLTDICWDKCVSSPGTYLSGKETSCLENCTKRFVESTQFIMQRAAHKAGAGGSGGDMFQ
jgi:hypothetical protein